jgi:hypothetical protein
MSAFYASDFEREFHLRLILGRIDAVPLNQPDQWRQLIATLEPLANVARNEPSAEGGVEESVGLKKNFVRLKSKHWRDAPPAHPTLAVWNLYAPSNRTCAREQRSPDVFVSIQDEQSLCARARVSVSLLIATACDLPGSEALIEAAGRQISADLPAIMVAKKVRPWGFPSETGYRCGISENQWLKGSLLDRPPSKNLLVEEWEEIIFPEPPC